jgi:hypothetical protein
MNNAHKLPISRSSFSMKFNLRQCNFLPAASSPFRSYPESFNRFDSLSTAARAKNTANPVWSSVLHTLHPQIGQSQAQLGVRATT